MPLRSWSRVTSPATVTFHFALHLVSLNWPVKTPAIQFAGYIVEPAKSLPQFLSDLKQQFSNPRSETNPCVDKIQQVRPLDEKKRKEPSLGREEKEETVFMTRDLRT